MFAYGLVLTLIGFAIVGYDFNVGVPLMIIGGALLLISYYTDKKKLRFINN